MKLLSKLLTFRHEVEVEAKGVMPVILAALALIVFTLLVLVFCRSVA